MKAVDQDFDESDEARKKATKKTRARNETLGEVACAFCGSTSPVRKNINGKLYYVCENGPRDDVCGVVMPNMPGFQAWMMEHATVWGHDREDKRRQADVQAVDAKRDAVKPKPKTAKDGGEEEDGKAGDDALPFGFFGGES